MPHPRVLALAALLCVHSSCGSLAAPRASLSLEHAEAPASAARPTDPARTPASAADASGGTSSANEATLEPAPDTERTAPLSDTYVGPPTAIQYGLLGDWGGVRQYLEEHGFTLGFQAYLEGNSVLDGGLRRRTTMHALWDLTTSFDLDRIADWKDTQLVMEAYAIGGENPSENVGDAQSFSDISAPAVAEIAQLYVEKWFAGRTCRLKLGKLDANSDFAAPANGIESIHSSTAFSPTNFTLVTYPNPACGILAGWVPNERWYLNLALYDGATWAGYPTGTLPASTFFGDPADLLWIAEGGYRWLLGSDELPGGVALGAWRHTGLFTSAGGGDVHNTSAEYATLDQVLSQAGDGQPGGTQSGFLQFGWANEDLAAIDRHLGLGLNWAGFCGARPDDALALYFSHAHFSRALGFTADELAIELGYKHQCCPGVVLRPDLQYIGNPGGDSNVDDAIVLSLRCELDF